MRKILSLLLLAALLLSAVPAPADDAAPVAENITRRCLIRTGGRGDRAYLYDQKYSTVWTPWNGATANIELPAGVAAGHILINWFTATTLWTVECLAEDGSVLVSYEKDSDYNEYQTIYAVPHDTRTILVHISGERCGISELHVYSEGELPADVNQWQPLPDKVDMMVVSAHYDDELLWFGGSIPYYAAQGKTVAVMYMTQNNPMRRNESLNAMWTCGVKYHPIYLDQQDERIPSYDTTLEHWGGFDAALARVVAQIRRYQPEVMITHDFGGEYGHNQHIATANLVAAAMEAAADPEFDPESAELYGVWQVKKLYIHMYEENAIYMEWDVPMDELGGKTPYEVATVAFEVNYYSQSGAYNMDMGRYQFDNTMFGLYHTTVGVDEAGNDFFENIP